MIAEVITDYQEGNKLPESFLASGLTDYSGEGSGALQSVEKFFDAMCATYPGLSIQVREVVERSFSNVLFLVNEVQRESI